MADINIENVFNRMSLDCCCKRLIDKCKLNSTQMTNLYIDIKSILKKYPPAKNENKFIYGKVAEARIIYWINDFLKCIDLDKTNNVGSEYKNDCEIFFEDRAIKYSIKVSKEGGEITLINKRNSNNNHSVVDCYFIICHIANKKLYIFKHDDSLNDFVKESNESIRYKGSIFKHLDKEDKNYYSFPVNEKTLEFENKILPTIEEVSIYERLSKELESENSKYY